MYYLDAKRIADQERARAEQAEQRIEQLLEQLKNKTPNKTSVCVFSLSARERRE